MSLKAELDYPKLQELCKIQCTGEEAARVLGIDYDTLNAALLRDGHEGWVAYNNKNGAEGKASLRRMQWKGAEAGNATMLVWLGKQYLGQSDKSDIHNTVTMDNITDDELNAKIDNLLNK